MGGPGEGVEDLDLSRYVSGRGISLFSVKLSRR